MQKSKNILIAPDKFKGSLSSDEICSILKSEIQHAIPEAIVVTCPLADGGDGSIEILSKYMEIKERYCDTLDPLGKPIKATYFKSEDTAYIELASASGLVLLEKSECNPMHTSTYGTGLLIKDAIDIGLKNIYLFLGGSSTNDGGIGIAAALGYIFEDQYGNQLSPKGSNLSLIARIKPPREKVLFDKFMICCDVNNPPYGPNGAAQVYGSQKGANDLEISELDKGIKNLCQQIKVYNGVSLSGLKGGGAAGATALCPSAFFNAEIISGFDFIAMTTGLVSKIGAADMVISGEGKLDLQSFNGKVVSGVSSICRKVNKQLWLVVGKNDLSIDEYHEFGANRVLSIFEKANNLEDAMGNSRKYLTSIGKEIALALK